MLETFAAWLAHLYAGLGYLQITLLMALESSLFPVPSELVMIPAGYLVATGKLNPFLAVLCGAGGSVIGASANYLLGAYVGRAVLLRYGRYLLIDADRYHEAERLFLRNANVATFIARFLPVIRHLISLPAGIFAMRWPPFLALTAAGSALWCSVLVAVGYYFGEPAVAIAGKYLHEVALVVVAGLALFILWFLLHGRRTKAAP